MNIARLQYLLVAVVFAALSLSAGAGETLYTGTCRNVTYGQDGLLKLYVTDGAKRLEGYMSISGYLVGSGPLKGSRDGNRFTFHTSDPTWGLEIDWQGSLQAGKLSGEYFVAPSRKMGTPQQSGEWQVSEFTGSHGATAAEATFYKRFLIWSEIELNNPTKLPDGTPVTGAQALFNAVHPVGTGVSVQVTDALVEWKEGTAHTDFKDIHRYSLDYTLYWSGIIQSTGWTKLRLAYNTELKAVTSHQMLQSTGTTNEELGNIAYGIGFLLGKAAMDSLLNSK